MISTATFIMQSVVLILAVHTTYGYGDDSNRNASEMLALSRNPVSGPSSPSARRLPTSLQWQGREYDIESGIDILMSIIRESSQSEAERHRALLALVMLYRRLEGHSCLDELTILYNDASELHKGAILTCLVASDDPRGIPVFVRVLDEEQSMKLRLRAASSLAHWNIRRGAAELVGLLDSKEILPKGARMPYVRDNALDLLRTKNRVKGWGFPDRGDELLKSISARSDLSDDEKTTLYHDEMNAQIRKWFAENEHRFPDWQLGDPLPPNGNDNKDDSSEP